MDSQRETAPRSAERLHVAILGSRGFPSTYGGFETLVRRLAPFLVARGHAVTVYGRQPGTGEPRVGVIDGVRVVHSRGVDTKAASTLTFGITAAVHACREQPDVVLVLNVANGFVLPLLRSRGISTVVNVDGVEWERAKWGGLARATFLAGARLSASTAELLIADACQLVRVWHDKFGVNPRFIPYGADVLDAVGAGRVRRLGLQPGSYALAVARLAPENNVDLFVEAIERLSWSVPAVVVGSANYGYRLEADLARLHAAGRVLWLGHVADQALLAELWGNAGVYFHGHSVGGTNPALLQAMGAGAPTLAVATEFNREVLGCEGQLVAPDSGVIAHEIERLLGDTARRHEMVERGRKIIGSRYRWDDVCLAYEDALTEVSRQRVRRSGGGPSGGWRRGRTVPQV